MATSREKKGVIPMESHHDQLFSADNKRTRNVNTVWKSPFEFSSSSAGPGPTKKTKVKNNDGTTTTTRNTKKKSNGRPPRRDSSGTGKTKSSTSSSNVTEGTRSSSIISMKQNNNKNRKTKKKSKKRNNNNKQMEEDMPITEDSLLESTFTTSTTPPSPMTDWDNSVSVSVSGDGDDSYLVDLEGGGENDSPPLNSQFRSIEDDDNGVGGDDDDSKVDDEEIDNSLSFSLTQMISNSILFPTTMMPKTTTEDGKPRSAYDKDAEWYCGSDSDSNMMDSIRSDGSSVLSLFRKKPKEKNKTTMMDMGNESSIKDLFSINNDQDGLSEPSMDLSILLGKDEESGNNIGGEVSITISHNNNNDNNSNNNNNVTPAMQLESLQIVSMNELLADIENDDDDANSSWSNSNSTNENGVSLLVDDDDDNKIKNDDIFSFDTFNPEEEEKNNEQESPTFLEKITSKNSVRSAFVVLGLTGVVDIILLGLFLTH